MEICHKKVYDAEFEARYDDYAGAGADFPSSVFVQPVYDGLKGFLRRIAVLPFIRGPLGNITGASLLNAAYTNIIEGLKCPYGSGSYGNKGRFPVPELHKKIPCDHKRFTVHGMLRNQRTLDRKESACANVEAHFLHIYTLCLNPFQDPVREVQTGRRSRYRAPDTCVKGLVALSVNGLGFPVQIRRNGNCAGNFKHPGERTAVLPGKSHLSRLAIPAHKFSPQVHGGNHGVIIGIIQPQDILLPLFGIADNAFPGGFCSGGKGKVVFHGFNGFQAEYLNMRTAFTPEMEAGRYNFSLIEYHHCPFREKIGQIAENGM